MSIRTQHQMSVGKTRGSYKCIPSRYNGRGIDPATLVGKYVVGYEIALEMPEKMRSHYIVLHIAGETAPVKIVIGDSKWGRGICMDKSLEARFKAASTIRPMLIVEASQGIGMRHDPCGSVEVVGMRLAGMVRKQWIWGEMEDRSIFYCGCPKGFAAVIIEDPADGQEQSTGGGREGDSGDSGAA
ncbi:hypothetical protein DRE_04384 [Drechslerella stenobrocha 248]|uniref:Uncharacterized protein n=1 Tax=Drechslerella stenobrocha 248 TaxID=1043628 RepID=W7HQJ0_9PEZI|nr:hypothetical protein DRE_04384 [Drechslerella stenobrocha 248]